MSVVVRRIGQSVALLFAASALTFWLVEMAPGDFFAELDADARVAPQTAEALRTRYGLSDPFPVRYVNWMRSVVWGDLGFSLTHRSPVAAILWDRAGNTLLLTLPALLLTWAIALPLGAWIALRRGGWLDRTIGGVTSTLLALPDLLVALLLLLLALSTGLFPTGGLQSFQAAEPGMLSRARDFVAHAFLPMAALVLTTLPTVVRHVRASVIEAAGAPAVHAARAHGIARSRITLRFLLPLAANPLVSLAGLSIGTLLSASLLIEVVMSWPGLGPLLVDALLARDVHVVLSVTLVATALLVFANLAADLTLYALDPRIRA